MKLISFAHARLPFIFLLCLYLATACKGPETTVVRQSPTTTDTTVQKDTIAAVPSAEFRQLNLGEINPVPSLDPLLAENASTMRALQLVYEGLVRYDANGSITPAIAKEWSVSSDSLQYRFTLRDDIYYHDSDAFTSGIGRKLKAGDIRFVFERMAKITVPDNAARLFMSIKGFEPYFQEQHKVFHPTRRVLDGIRGIHTPNDTTVVFELAEKDAHFMQKLASPYALIYPREAVTDHDPSQFKTVGTGPFSLSQKRGDSLYTFARFNEYHIQDQPDLNRVDVIVKRSESDLFKTFASGDLQLIPELGLQTIQGTLNNNEDLKPNYTDRYTLVKPGGETEYRLNFNMKSDLNQRKAESVVALFDSADTFSNIPKEFIRFYLHDEDTVRSGFSSADTLNINNRDDSYSRQFMILLRDKLQNQGATLQIYDIYVPTRNNGLFISHRLPFYRNENPEINEKTLVSFSVPHLALYHSGVKNILFNPYPWWIDLRTATVPSNNNQ